MDVTIEQRRYAKGLAVRERTIDAASRLFAARGYGGCSVADLAQHAGITRNQLFHHFSNKETLALECVASARQAWLDEVITPAGIFPQPISRLVYMLDKLSEHQSGADWPYVRLLACLAASDADLPAAVKLAVRQTLGEIYQALRELCRDLKRSAGLPGGGKARIAAAQILAGVLGAAALGGASGDIPAGEVLGYLKALFTQSAGLAG